MAVLNITIGEAELVEAGDDMRLVARYINNSADNRNRRTTTTASWATFCQQVGVNRLFYGVDDNFGIDITRKEPFIIEGVAERTLELYLEDLNYVEEAQKRYSTYRQLTVKTNGKLDPTITSNWNGLMWLENWMNEAIVHGTQPVIHVSIG